MKSSFNAMNMKTEESYVWRGMLQSCLQVYIYNKNIINAILHNILCTSGSQPGLRGPPGINKDSAVTPKRGKY